MTEAAAAVAMLHPAAQVVLILVVGFLLVAGVCAVAWILS